MLDIRTVNSATLLDQDLDPPLPHSTFRRDRLSLLIGLKKFRAIRSPSVETLALVLLKQQRGNKKLPNGERNNTIHGGRGEGIEIKDTLISTRDFLSSSAFVSPRLSAHRNQTSLTALGWERITQEFRRPPPLNFFPSSPRQPITVSPLFRLKILFFSPPFSSPSLHCLSRKQETLIGPTTDRFAATKSLLPISIEDEDRSLPPSLFARADFIASTGASGNGTMGTRIRLKNKRREEGT